MTLGLRLVFLLSIPAGVGLFLLAEPITRLLFERGNFLPDDTRRVAWITMFYAAGIWASCASPVVIRGFYALCDFATPVRIGVWMVGLNLAMNLTLIWPLAEAGLALSTTVAAMIQFLLLLACFSRRRARLDWRRLAATVVRTVAATAAMGMVVHLTLAQLPDGGRLTAQLLRVGVPLVSGRGGVRRGLPVARRTANWVC